MLLSRAYAATSTRVAAAATTTATVSVAVAMAAATATTTAELSQVLVMPHMSSRYELFLRRRWSSLVVPEGPPPRHIRRL